MNFIISVFKILMNIVLMLFMAFYPFITRMLATLTVLAAARVMFTGNGHGYAIAFFMAFICLRLLFLAPCFDAKKKAVR